MSERERWVVYPLLFLALGVSLRDKLIKTTASQRVQTESLLVTGTNGQPLAVLGNQRFDHISTGGRDVLQVDVIRADQLEVNNLLVRRNLTAPLAIVERVIAAKFVQRVGNWYFDLAPLIGRLTPPSNKVDPPTPSAPAAGSAPLPDDGAAPAESPQPTDP